MRDDLPKRGEQPAPAGPDSLQHYLLPDWAVPARVRALLTTRASGVSAPPYGRWRDGVPRGGGLNLGLHTGDDPLLVQRNRERLLAHTRAPIAWLEQVHGCEVVSAHHALVSDGARLHADASVADGPGVACAVMTADCLPVLMCDTRGRVVGAAHAGWRGLLQGVLERTAAALAARAGNAAEGIEVLAHLGPAIGPGAFEVGAEVRDAFLAASTAAERTATGDAFHAVASAHERGERKYLCDLVALARVRLARASVVRVTGGQHCTVTEIESFYSYRRDRLTGRMAAVIWLAD